MPRVRTRASFINLGNGTVPSGTIQDISAEAAEYLIASGAVELVRGADADTPERAAVGLEKSGRTDAPRPSGGSSQRIQRRG